MKPEVADPVDEKALRLAKIAVGLLEPEADQQIAQPDPPPSAAEEELEEVLLITSISIENVNSEM